MNPRLNPLDTRPYNQNIPDKNVLIYSALGCLPFGALAKKGVEMGKE